jgi:membrane dipeptidase
MRIPFFTLWCLAAFYFVGCSTAPNQEKALTEEELMAKANAIHQKFVTIDTHADTPMRLTRPGFDLSVRQDPYESGSKVDFPRMVEGGLDAIYFIVFLPQGPLTPEGFANAKTSSFTILDSIYAAVGRHTELAEIITEPEEVYAVKQTGKRALYLGLENGYPIGEDLSLIEEYYNKGIRYITLCHSANNHIADSSTDPNGPLHGGISEFGAKVIAEMNRLGLMVDVSHASDDAVLDALKLSKAPIIASHSSAKAICDHPRNLNDELLKGIKETSGVIQLCLLNEYVKVPPANPVRDSVIAAFRAEYGSMSTMTPEEREVARAAYQKIQKEHPVPLATVQDAIDHIDHMVKIVGIDHVGIGGDFDGGGGIDGVFDVSEMKNITVELLRRGYSEADIEKIWGGNLLRVHKEVREIGQRIRSGEINL